MKFIIESTARFQPDKVCEDYPCLKNYSYEKGEDKKEWASYYDRCGTITINTLEELIQLMNECNRPLIISKDPYVIEIYDSYRE